MIFVTGASRMDKSGFNTPVNKVEDETWVIDTLMYQFKPSNVEEVKDNNNPSPVSNGGQHNIVLLPLTRQYGTFFKPGGQQH